MKQCLRITLVFAAVLVAAVSGAAEDRQAKQSQLDDACEEARQRQIAIDRPPLIEACVKEGKSRSDCDAQFANYGGRSGARAPLYYDLPSCEAASDYQHSQRRGN